jgi:hypothetical protein
MMFNTSCLIRAAASFSVRFSSALALSAIAGHALAQDAVFIDGEGVLNADIKGFSSDWSGTTTTGDGTSILMALAADNSAADKSSDVGFSLENRNLGFQWAFRTFGISQGFAISKIGTRGAEIRIDNPTDDFRNVSILMGNGARLSDSGQWLNASSRAYKDAISDLSAEEALSAFAELRPVTYRFKSDTGGTREVGFIAEDVPELVSTGTRDALNSLELVALLTKVVQHQQQLIEQQVAASHEQKELNRQQEETLASLKRKVKELERVQVGSTRTLSLSSNLGFLPH